MFEDALFGTSEGLAALVSALACLGSDGGGGEAGTGTVGVSDAERIDQLAALERVKAAAAAAQVRVTAAFVDSQEQVAQQWRQRARECSDAGDFEGWRAARDQARAASLPEGDQQESDRAGAGPAVATGAGVRRRRPSGMTGVAAQVALARRESPVQGAAHVRLALALSREMPHTLAALEAGELSEWRAQIIARETATLTSEQRSLVDAEVVGDPAQQVGALGDLELARRVRAVAYRIDAASVVARAAKAQADRRVTLRPAPDTMAYLTALLPVAQAVAAHAALTAAADAARAAGDERGKGQVMADTLVARVTGQETAEAVPVEVQLVMSAGALFAAADTPAQVRGYGTVPAQWARDLLTPPAADGADPGATTLGAGASGVAASSATRADCASGTRVWLRRLFTHPVSGSLVAMDSVRRAFDGGLRRYLLARDAGTCRTPWCDAPARHVDHVHDHADGGPTSEANGQGLCVRCNLTKQLPGFTATTVTDQRPGAPHAVATTTPTGHTYSSQAPPLLPGLLHAEPDVQWMCGDGLSEPLDVETLSPLERMLALGLAA